MKRLILGAVLATSLIGISGTVLADEIVTGVTPAVAVAGQDYVQLAAGRRGYYYGPRAGAYYAPPRYYSYRPNYARPYYSRPYYGGYYAPYVARPYNPYGGARVYVY